jgi:adenosine deaminase
MNLRNIPKVELHRHLEGAVRFSTLVELARNKGLDLPYNDYKKLHDRLVVHSPMKDLKSVLDKFWTTQSILDSEEVWERISFEACEDAFNEGVVLLELRYSPSFASTNHPTMTFEKIHRSIVKGIERALEIYPMAVGLIGILGRIQSIHDAEKSCDFIIENKETFVAIDLADNEEGFDCKPFAPLFLKAKKAGLHITAHSGEIPGGEFFVKDAIEFLYAERIGHGVQIYKSKEMINFVKEKNVLLELCPISNYLTNAIPDLKAHPLKFLMNEGVKVSINSDDPGIFGTTLLDDYEVLKDHHGFTLEDFQHCNQMAYDACFIPDKIKSKFW